jgi:hypothetical protein
MTARQPARQREIKLTSQLCRGDLIALDGLGGFTVTSVEPHGTQSLIKLATANLAVICARNVRWTAITPGSALYLHGYQACGTCNGKGIVFADHGDDVAWDSDRTRWVTN